MSKSKVPPIIIQHPEDGTFRIGRERDEESVEPTVRKADVSLQGGSSEAGGPAASLRLFHD